MNSFLFQNSQDYLKTASFPSAQHSNQKSLERIRPSISSKLCRDTRYKNQQACSLVNMIGKNRLIQSLDNFSQNKYYKCLGEKGKVANERGCKDRFIPNRKGLQVNYKLKENQINQQNIDIRDPQCVSIAQIYSEQVLGSKQIFEQQIAPFRNSNVLKYKNLFQQKEFLEPESPTKSILVQPYSRYRKVSKIPCKVLDAPALQDDFYLNLIDWSHDNQLAVGLGNCIYLWNALTSKVTKLCELNNDLVTSVTWALKGSHISIGCDSGTVEVWDVNENKLFKKLYGHQNRVGSMAWNSTVLATGSRDKNILLRDIRTRKEFELKMQEHSQQICGLKWSFDEQHLASGGNDNKVAVWSAGGQILNKFTDHKAAVKAIAWSPHQHGLLATGGGTADRMIKLRNVFTGSILCERDAGSQVCNVAFSKSLHEIVTTHGYSQNQINIWSYPNMKKIASLIGHSHRVLYLATSPDGSTIVTGAGDQTLRFWNVFPLVNQKPMAKKCTELMQVQLR